MTFFIWLNIWIAILGVCTAVISKKQVLSSNSFIAVILGSLLPAAIAAALTKFNLSRVDTLTTLGTAMNSIGVDIILTYRTASFTQIATFSYVCVTLILILTTFGTWAKLQTLDLEPTAIGTVYKTTKPLPPLTLSWPRRLIVLPESVLSLPKRQKEMIISHERVHLRHYDAEVTLMLLILKHIFWINPAMAWLVNSWRDGADLRADRAVIVGTNLEFRRAYAGTLLSCMGNKNGEQALPCPSAALTSNRTRSVKMRLSKIMTEQQPPRKTALYNLAKIGLGLSTLFAGIALNAAASPKNTNINVRPLLRVPPVMPKSCAGLDTQSIETVTKSMTISGETIERHVANVGTVLVSFDIAASGATENIFILKTAHECFNKPTKDAVSQWRYTPNDPQNGVKNMIKFLLTEDAEGSLSESLRKFSTEE